MPEKRVTAAEEMAKSQRDISVSEFFAKNRHLLGFDNPRKALLTAIKEAVDNSLDACEEAKILPEVYVEVKQLREDRFRIIVEDNGPGIVRAQIPNIFAKLLYGSKFHRLRMSRGQQGIGISASAMYGQLTTGKGIRIISKISPKHPAHFYELLLDTAKNQPKIVEEHVVDWNKEHGTKVELEIEASYLKGRQSVDEYIKETALVNPHVLLRYKNPADEMIIFPRGVKEMPEQPKEIKPHPYGVELGILMKMLSSSLARNISGFLQNDFCRVSAGVAKQICDNSGLTGKEKPKDVDREAVERLYAGIQKTKIIAPPTNCLSPIGEEALLAGLKKEINAEFYSTITRPPSVYRGNPFQVECGLAYGSGELDSEGLVRVMRFANRVPLLYQPGACSSVKSIVETAWRNYGISQSKGALPTGPILLVVHMASVWVPFTSESKEAIAHYPEIIKEMKLCLQECGRRLASHLRRTVRARERREKIDLFEKYVPELSRALCKITGDDKESVDKSLTKVLNKLMGELSKKNEKEEQ